MTSVERVADFDVAPRREAVRYGVVGLGFIARLHLDAIRRLEPYASVRLEPVAAADTTRAAIDGFSRQFRRTSTDYRDVTSDDDVDVVIVAVPNDRHHEVVADALRHGKYVVCEKPLASNLVDAKRIHSAASASAFEHAVAFVFRTCPTVELARQIISRGDIGDVFAYRGHMIHGHGLDPEYPMSWRMDPNRSGGGASVDIGSHAVDMARYLVGDEVRSVSALSTTVLPTRPESAGSSARAAVLVDDHTAMLMRFRSGATAQVTATWAAAGESTDVAFEVLGTEGSLRFSWRRPEELWFAERGQPPRTLIIGPDGPDADLRFPVAGLGLGYTDAFASFHRRVVDTLVGRPTLAPPTIADAARCAHIIEAAQLSAKADGAWHDVEQ